MNVSPPQFCANCGAALPPAAGDRVSCGYCGRSYAVERRREGNTDMMRVVGALEARIAVEQAKVAAQQAQVDARRRRRGGGGFGRFVLMGCALAVVGGLGAGALLVLLVFVAGNGATSAVTRDADVRLCGSNTVGAELAPALAEAFLAHRGATSVRREAASDVVRVSGQLAGRPFVIEIRSQGTGTAFNAMKARRCDVAMASRPATAAESAAMGGKLTEHVIALDGIAILVGPSVNVQRLDLNQLVRLFSGSASWASVGGGAAPVQIFAHDNSSGTYDTFRTRVLGNSALAASARRFAKSADIVQGVASAPGGIGFTTVAAARGARIVPVGEPGAPAQLPSDANIARESYALTRRLYLYSNAQYTRPAADGWIDFALSADGQRAVARSGFVDLSVKEEAVAECTDCPPVYVEATRGAQRMSLDFRFRTGSSDLDARAARDVERVAELRRSAPNLRVRLLGFTDARGAAATNERLSLERAETVKLALAAVGMNAVETRGMGSIMPVASNDTDAGRERNRRVEAWLIR